MSRRPSPNQPPLTRDVRSLQSLVGKARARCRRAEDALALERRKRAAAEESLLRMLATSRATTAAAPATEAGRYAVLRMCVLALRTVEARDGEFTDPLLDASDLVWDRMTPQERAAERAASKRVAERATGDGGG